ncbi:MAG: hypothetical protein RL757_2572 [Bacteroidota bacterium]
MKKLVSMFSFVAFFATLSMAQPVMQLEKTEVQYGTIAQGSDPLRKVKFKNTGNEALIIKSAQGSCGCTVPNFKREPIMPGETSEVEIRYDTQRLGEIYKTVTIETNEGGDKRVLTVKGNVVEKKMEEGVPAAAPSLIGTPKR